MNSWYLSLCTQQRIFLFIVSLAASLVIVGIPFLLVLIYLELGGRFNGDGFNCSDHERRQRAYESISQYKECRTKAIRICMDSGLEYLLAALSVNYCLARGIAKGNGKWRGLFMALVPPTRETYLFGEYSYKFNVWSMEWLASAQKNYKIDTIYENMNKAQKIFVWAVSIMSCPFLVGLMPMAFLIYAELGQRYKIHFLEKLIAQLRDSEAAADDLLDHLSKYPPKDASVLPMDAHNLMSRAAKQASNQLS